MAADTYYRAVSAALLDSGECAIYVREKTRSPRVVRLDRPTAWVFGRVQGSKTLDGHAAFIQGQAYNGSVEETLARLRVLVQHGLLQPQRLAGATNGIGKRPSTDQLMRVAIVTAERPGMLSRCLRALIAHCALHQRVPAVLVVDGSHANAHLTRRVISEAERVSGWRLTYVGRREVDRLRAALATTHVPKHVVDFTLESGGIGASRNVAALFGAGDRLFMLDDDVVCNVWRARAAGNNDAVALSGHGDPASWEFFDTRREALASCTPVQADLLGAHAALLGTSVREVVNHASGNIAGESACGHLLDAVSGLGEGHVRVTFTGLAGDAGLYCARRLLFLDGPIRQTFVENEKALDTANRTREVTRSVSATTITHASLCMAYATGLANHEVLPPFLPIGRNEDGLFGALLSMGDPHSLSAHIPLGIVHDSARRSAYDGPTCLSARQTRLSDLLQMLLKVVAPAVLPLSREERLASVGQFYVDLGRLPTAEFSELLTEVILKARVAELRLAEAGLARGQNTSHILSALAEYRGILLASIQRPEFCLPIEVCGDNVSQRWDKTKQIVARFGQSLQAWPDLWHAASRHELLSGIDVSMRS